MAFFTHNVLEITDRNALAIAEAGPQFVLGAERHMRSVYAGRYDDKVYETGCVFPGATTVERYQLLKLMLGIPTSIDQVANKSILKS